MIEHSFPFQRKGWLRGARGKVINSRAWNETHITSSGGGGYIHEGTGRIEAPKIQSQIIEKGEVWIRSESGKDVQIPLRIPAVEGQDLIVFWGNLNEINHLEGPYLYWKNFSSGRHALLTPLNVRFFETKEETSRRNRRFWWVWLAIAAFCAFVGWQQSGPADDTGLIIGTIIGVIGGMILAALAYLRWDLNARMPTLLADFEALASKDGVEWSG